MKLFEKSLMPTDSKYCKTAILFKHLHKWEKFIRKRSVMKEFRKTFTLNICLMKTV